MRAGASFLSIDDLKNDCPVLFIALLPMSPGVPCVARSGESARTLPVMLSGDKRSYITRGRSVCVLFIILSEMPFRSSFFWIYLFLYYLLSETVIYLKELQSPTLN